MKCMNMLKAGIKIYATEKVFHGPTIRPSKSTMAGLTAVECGNTVIKLVKKFF